MTLVMVIMIALEGKSNLLQNKIGKKVVQEEVNMPQEEIMLKETIQHVKQETFEEEVLKSEKIVLVDFYTNWCSSCQKLSPVLEEMAKERKDIKIVKIDADTEPDLIKKYEIQGYPTVVLIKDGEEKDRILGYMEKQEIEEKIESIQDLNRTEFNQ